MSMSKNTKGILAVLAVSAVAMAIWHFTHQNAKAYAKTIVKMGGHRSYATLITFEEGFLKAWVKALIKGKTDFLYQDQTYNTQGGTKK